MAEGPEVITAVGPVVRFKSEDKEKPGSENATTSKRADMGQASALSKEKKIGHRRVDADGTVSFKKTPTNQLMQAIQLGIGHSVGSLSSKPERDLLMQDFMVVETVFFPNSGSSVTAGHKFIDFQFKTYAPMAFRYFRELFGIQPDDFMLSLCSEAMRELSNPGASGSVFYLTNDDEFILKTVQHKEAEFLQKLLPGYYMNLNQNPRTLLPKFFGLYCYISGGKNIRIVVMNNLLPSTIKLHQKYDLKGSTYKRKASKSERLKTSPTYKDLDFMEHYPEGIYLEAEKHDALFNTIRRDCRVLESFKIMDFSFLVGIHNLDQAKREREASRSHSHSSPRPGSLAAEARDKTPKQRLIAHSTPMENIDVAIEDSEESRAEGIDAPTGGIPAKSHKGERLLLYLGVIDILQSYRLKKKLEHTMKSMIADGETISVCRPSFYSERFLNFLSQRVFKRVASTEPERKSRKFKTTATAFLAIKHSPSKRKQQRGQQRLGQSLPESELKGASGSVATPLRPDVLPASLTPPPPFKEREDPRPSQFRPAPLHLRSDGDRSSSVQGASELFSRSGANSNLDRAASTSQSSIKFVDQRITTSTDSMAVTSTPFGSQRVGSLQNENGQQCLDVDVGKDDSNGASRDATSSSRLDGDFDEVKPIDS